MKNIGSSKNVIILFLLFGTLRGQQPGLEIDLAVHPKSFGLVQSDVRKSVLVSSDQSTFSESTNQRLANCSFTIDLGSEEEAKRIGALIARYVSQAMDGMVVQKGARPPLSCLVQASKNNPSGLEVAIEYNPAIFYVQQQVRTNPREVKAPATMSLVIAKTAKNLRAQSYVTPTVFTASNHFGSFPGSFAWL